MEDLSRWTHPSVVRIAQEGDPITVVRARAQQVVASALDKGWTGPPFDPVELAKLLKIRVKGRGDIQDAHILADEGTGLTIEFNPNQPAARVRYSIAHELGHSLFSDCADEVRNRAQKKEIRGDLWQLEMLCNIAASEMLMPIGSIPRLSGSALDLENLFELRDTFAVSTEAFFIRAAHVAAEPAAAFCASPASPGARYYRINYVIGSPGWKAPRPRGEHLPPSSVVGQCIAIGYTAMATESWPGLGRVHVSAVGIPPYPGDRLPRVAGFLKPGGRHEGSTLLTFLRGDATRPQVPGNKLIVHVVNDTTPRWGGGGFAAAVAHRWPEVMRDFAEWTGENHERLVLGNVRLVQMDDGLAILHIVAQRGYGRSSRPRIRYAALRQGLAAAAGIARDRGSSVHMPRIGTGQAGGSWKIVEDLIRSTLGAAEVPVFVYDLPGVKPPGEDQMTWEFSDGGAPGG